VGRGGSRVERVAVDRMVEVATGSALPEVPVEAGGSLTGVRVVARLIWSDLPPVGVMEAGTTTDALAGCVTDSKGAGASAGRIKNASDMSETRARDNNAVARILSSLW